MFSVTPLIILVVIGISMGIAATASVYYLLINYHIDDEADDCPKVINGKWTVNGKDFAKMKDIEKEHLNIFFKTERLKSELMEFYRSKAITLNHAVIHC